MIALLEAKAAGLWSRGHLANNLLAGLIVGIVALPLAMAFAIASGARPEHGLYTAIVAGALTSLFGGSRLQIAGPTGAFVAVLSVITAQHGIAGLQVATLMAGLILLAFGVARLGAVIKYIPDPVIVGFTAGIGVIIFVGQWKDFFGLSPAPSGLHFHEKFLSLVQALPTLHLATTGLALLAFVIMAFGGRWLKRIPAPLVAMIAATVAQAVFHFDGVATIGSAFGGIPRELPTLSLPTLSLGQILTLVGPAFTIALLGAIESLLSAVVADGMAGTRHDSNQELIGQGIANLAAPLFGGFAATGAIARTATSIRNGATSPLAGLVHAGFLILVILLLAPLAAAIPLCSLAAILFVIAWNMSDVPHFIRLVRTAPRPDVGILLLTFTLTVFVDLVVAVNVGVVIAALLFMRRMAQSVSIELHDESAVPDAAEPERRTAENGIVVYSIDGPFFFGAAEKLERTLAHIQRRATTLILRLGRMPFVDATGMQALEEIVMDFKRHGATVLLSEVRLQARACRTRRARRSRERAGDADRSARTCAVTVAGHLKDQRVAPPWRRSRTCATKPARNFLSASRVAASASSPSLPISVCAREIMSRPPAQRSHPSVRSTGSQAFCDRMVPNPPGDAPASATGRSRNTRAVSAGGRDSQSMTFLATPGMPLLYSGVTSSSPSAAAIASLSTVTAAGNARSSRSPSYNGTSAIDRMPSSLSGGIAAAAARSTAEFNDPRRRLPESPTRRIRCDIARLCRGIAMAASRAPAR
jgi:SulP family sulfate permease